MIIIGVCDIDTNSRLEICKLLDIYFSSHSYSYEVICFEDGDSLIKFYKEHEKTLNLLFIDINMQNKNGFDILKMIRSYDSDLSIAINTQTARYSLESFEVWPLHYNIKPLSYKTLTSIIDRYIDQSRNIKEENLLVKNGKKFINLSFNEISYIESQNTTLKIHMNNYEVLKTYGKLDDLEKQLSNSRFLRCHKSFLINMDYVKSVEAYKFTTIFGDTVSIKQRESSKIKKRYYDYITQKESYEKELI